jgi:hypothetical protein
MVTRKKYSSHYTDRMNELEMNSENKNIYKDVNLLARNTSTIKKNKESLSDSSK